MSQLDFYRTILSAKWQDRSGRQRQIANAQSARLKHILQTAVGQVPFQERRIGKPNPNVTPAEQLARIAPTSKQEMAQHFAETINQNQIGKLAITKNELTDLAANPKDYQIWFKNKCLVSTTSGTTGVVGLVLNSRKTWAIQRAVVFSRTCRNSIPLYRFNAIRPYRIAYAVIDSPWSVSNQAAFDSAKANSWLAKVKCFSIAGTRDDLVENLADFKPDLLQSYPNYLEVFAKRKLSGTDLGFNPQVISSFADLLLDRQRQLIAQAFPDAKIVDHYGSTECQPIANSCLLGNLHLNSDYAILEPVDENDQPVSNGEFSHHALITNLINDFQPFIRFRLTDSVRILPEPCKCGCPFPVVEIRGRSFLQLQITDNQDKPATLNGASFLPVLFKLNELSTYLVSYHRKNHIEINITFDGEAKQEEVIAKLESGLRTFFASEGCDQSVSFSINCIEDGGFAPKHFKKKLFDVTYNPTPD